MQSAVCFGGRVSSLRPESAASEAGSIVMSKAAYGLYRSAYLGCWRAPIKHRIGSWIQPSHRRHGVSRMAPSQSRRYGSAGSLLAWRPVVRDTRALVGLFRGITPGLLQGECSVTMLSSPSGRRSCLARSSAPVSPIPSARARGQCPHSFRRLLGVGVVKKWVKVRPPGSVVTLGRFVCLSKWVKVRQRGSVVVFSITSELTFACPVLAG